MTDAATSPTAPNAYSPSKALYHAHHVADFHRHEFLHAPVHVQLILSDLCNQDCSFCAYRMTGYTSNELFTAGAELAAFGHNNPKRQITTAKAKEIIESCAALGVQGIQFTGGGEPTVHPDCATLMHLAQALGMKTALVTNGLLVNDRVLDVIGRSEWVRVSIDAGKAETYGRVRRVNASQFERVRQSVRDICRRRDALDKLTGHRVTTVGVGFVVTAENWMEIEDAAANAALDGADNFRISAVFQPDGSNYFDREWGYAAGQAAKRACGLSTGNFTVHNLFGARVDDLQDGPPEYDRCGYQLLTTFIGADLNVYRCCNTAYSTHGLLGSIKDQSFESFWRSEALFTKLKSFDARTCERCQFNDRNRLLYHLTKEPVHAAFP